MMFVMVTNLTPPELLEEFRVGGVFVRLTREPTPGDHQRIACRFAPSRPGLDAANVLAPADLWELGNAVSAAGLLAYTHRPGVPIAEQTLAERMHRLGARDLHKAGTWGRTVPLRPGGLAPSVQWRPPAGRAPDQHLDRRFTFEGLAGRLHTGGQPPHLELRMELAESESLLGTPDAFEVPSILTVHTLLVAAAALAEIAYPGVTDGERAICFERLSRLGVRLL